MLEIIPILNKWIGLYSLMEECEVSQPSHFQKELLNLSQLQQTIERTRRELSQLGKLQNLEDRQLTNIYNLSITTSRNKLNLYHSHLSQDNLHNQHAQQLSLQQLKVKDIREQQARGLREAKDMLKRSRQHERLVIRNKSIKYEETIRNNKNVEKELRQQAVRGSRLEKQNYKQGLADSRHIECKKKEVEYFNQTLARIDTQPSLMKELQSLMKEKDLAESTLEEKRSLKKQVRNSVEKMKKMKVNEVKVVVEQGGQQRLLGQLDSIDHLRSVLQKSNYKMRV